ncbi:acetolactate decarboxylase [Sorangium sp. So ce385]|uniref:acetolactate decarboxylase n=1 Tax=Sorangium sp. So ce385 TaxID=3133308 RepID=UPI003F5B37ED
MRAMRAKVSSVLLGALLASAALACTRSSEPAQGAPAAEPAQGAPAAEPAQGAPAGVQVRSFGALRAIMHEGQTGPAVRVGDVVPGPHAFGVGALSELRGEVTVVDDAIWTSYARDDGTLDVRPSGAEEQATLFVMANVARWQEATLDADVPDGQIDARIEALLRERGLDAEVAVPVQVRGGLRDLGWHVIDGRKLAPGGGHADHVRASVSGTLPDAEGTLVGFFSKRHHGVFTHMGSNTHFHVVLPERSLMGHVDRVTLARGARVLVPAP